MGVPIPYKRPSGEGRPKTNVLGSSCHIGVAVEGCHSRKVVGESEEEPVLAVDSHNRAVVVYMASALAVVLDVQSYTAICQGGLAVAVDIRIHSAVVVVDRRYTAVRESKTLQRRSWSRGKLGIRSFRRVRLMMENTRTAYTEIGYGRMRS